MNAEDIEILLKTWGLEAYIQVFAENKIDVNTLVLLDYELTKDLIKPIGDRAKFLKNLADWRKITSNDEPNQLYDVDDVVDTLNPSHRVNDMNDVLPVNTDNISNDNDSTIIQNFVVVPADTEETKPLRELLKQTNEGRGILNLYEAEGKLSNNGRRKLCNIIVTDLLKNNPEQRVDSTTLLNKAQQIKDVFQKENIHTYFIPYINNNKLKIKRCAKGKLYDCLQNKRRQYRESKVIEQKKTPVDIYAPGPSGTSENSSEKKELIPSDDLLWLQSACDPWHTVEQKWKNTAKYRLKEIKEGSIKIDEYMNKYPALKNPSGYQLLVNDFDILYPGHKEKLFENFALIKKKILDFIPIVPREVVPRGGHWKKIPTVPQN